MLDLFQILAQCDPDLHTIIQFVRSLLNIICIGVPILLIVFGSIDLGKAVMASDEKEIKGATSKLIKRAVAAVIVFFIPTIVGLIMNLVKNTNVPGADSWATCWDRKAGYDQ